MNRFSIHLQKSTLQSGVHVVVTIFLNFRTEDTTFVRGILGALLQPRVDPLSLLRDEVPEEPPLQARVL